MDWHSRRIRAILENALQEDKATKDATSKACIDPRQRAAGTIIVWSDCVLSGVGVIPRIFEIFAELDGTVIGHPEVISHPEVFDGVRLHRGQTIAVIRHNAHALLACERVILNILQRLTGIATLTRKFVDVVAGTKVHILDTRKTMPGMRILDKYGVRCGGGFNHRLDLSDGVLIKNNHIALGGGVARVLEKAIKNRQGQQPIEIEVRNMAELEIALENGAEAVLLDNMPVEEVRKAVERIAALDRRVPVECSGGIALANVKAYAETGVDYISSGALTHSAASVDMSLRIIPV